MNGLLGPEALLAGLAVLVAALHLFRIARVNNRPTEGDAFTYLRVAREVRAQRAAFPELNFYHTGEREYLQLPPLLMWLLAPVASAPYRLLINVPALIDLLVAAAVYAGGVGILGLEPWRALLAALVLLLTPINCITSGSLTPRSLGLLWLTVLVLAMTAYVSGGPALWLLPAALAVCLALLSQRMVTQIIVLLCPLVALGFVLGGYPRFGHLFTVTLAGFLLAFLVTGGRYRAVITDHLRRVLVHTKIGQQQRLRLEFGNPLQMVKASPWLLLLAAVLWATGAAGLPPALWLSAAFVVGALLLAVFWVMGNSVNHVYFAGPFVGLLLAASLPGEGPWLAAVALTGILCAGITGREFQVLRRQQMPEAWFRCFRFIRDQGLGGRALVLPQVGFAPLVYYSSLVLVASGHGVKALTFDRLTIKRGMAEPGFLASFAATNGVDYILLDRARASPAVAAVFAGDGQRHFREIHADDGLALFRVSTPPAAAPD